MSHTPGPWKARDYPNKNGDIWIDCDAYANSVKGKCLGGTLATAHATGTGKGNIKENAYLIAAAPELLEALKELVLLMDADDTVEVGCHCTDSGDGLVMCPWCKAKVAIAKTEGR